MAILPTTTLAITLLATAQVGDAAVSEIGDTQPSITIGLGTDGRAYAGLDESNFIGANQSASISSSPPAQRHRLPPVRLARHEEEADHTEANSEGRLLPRRGSSQSSGDSPKSISAGSSLVTVGTSLAVVLGLFFVMVWFMRRAAPRGSRSTPEEVLEVLGRAPLPGKQQLQVVRFGSKLVLLAATPDGVEAVSEITDPDEVQQMVALCRRESTGSSSQAFQEILNQMGREPARGFLDQPARTVPTRR